MALGLIRVGNLITYVELVINDTNTSDVNAILDISGATIKQITFIDPDGVQTIIAANFVTNGTDGRMFVNTSGSGAGLWTKAGVWKWFGTVFLTGGIVVSTNDVVREILE